MMSQRIRSVSVVALSCALALLSQSVVALTSIDEPFFSAACITNFIGDGDCDLVNDNVDCDFDGGDCCECTCVSTEQFVCGENGGFACLDPSAACVDDDDVTTLPDFEINCIDNFISDGDCDPTNNNEVCDFDGGDCCECTCVSGPFFTCGDLGDGGFDCADPEAPEPPSCDVGSFSFGFDDAIRV